MRASAAPAMSVDATARLGLIVGSMLGGRPADGGHYDRPRAHHAGREAVTALVVLALAALLISEW